MSHRSRPYVTLPLRPPPPTAEEATAHRQYSDADLAVIVLNAASVDPHTRLGAVQAARRLLSADKQPPIEALVRSGVLPALVEGLQADDRYGV